MTKELAFAALMAIAGYGLILHAAYTSPYPFLGNVLLGAILVWKADQLSK